MKYVIRTALALFVIAVVAGGVMFWLAGRSGSGAIETWIGSQLQLIANGYLNPRLSFTDLDYEYPDTVSIRELRLVADDPADPGRKVEILTCGQATVVLAEIPRHGQPIVIKQVILDRPLIAGVAESAESNRLIGFSNLVRGEGDPAPQADPPKLSDVLQIRLIEIRDGRIVYDPRIAGTEPMELDQINTRLNVELADQGWYKLSTAIGRDRLFDLTVAAQLNLDTLAVRDLAAKLIADVRQDSLGYLPPQIQKLLLKHEVRGRLDALLMGELPLARPQDGSLSADIRLADARVRFDEFCIPVTTMDLSMRLEDRRLVIPTMDVAALNGTMSLSGSAQLNEQWDASIKVAISGMRLEELLAARQEGQPPALAGLFDANLQADAPARLVLARLGAASTQPATAPAETPRLPENWGSASVDLTQGRIVKLPVVSRIINAIRSATKLVTSAGQQHAQPNERLSMSVDLTHDRAQVNDFRYVGPVVAARGKGVITLDRRLDMTIAAGPVEKVQSLLGRNLGDAIGRVTDQLVAYRVTGEITNPQIGVQVGGNLGGRIEQGIGTLGQNIGQGIDRIGQGIGNIVKPGESEK